MEPDGQRESENVEDRRGGMGARGDIGIGTIVIAIIAWYFGFDPQTVIDSSEQRERWFRTGFDTGSLEACDTFSASRV